MNFHEKILKTYEVSYKDMKKTVLRKILKNHENVIQQTRKVLPLHESPFPLKIHTPPKRAQNANFKPCEFHDRNIRRIAVAGALPKAAVRKSRTQL